MHASVSNVMLTGALGSQLVIRISNWTLTSDSSNFNMRVIINLAIIALTFLGAAYSWRPIEVPQNASRFDKAIIDMKNNMNFLGLLLAFGLIIPVGLYMLLIIVLGLIFSAKVTLFGFAGLLMPALIIILHPFYSYIMNEMNMNIKAAMNASNLLLTDVVYTAIDRMESMYGIN